VAFASASSHPGGNPGANLKSIPHRCYLREAAFVWEFTKETIHLPLGCLQGGSGPCVSSAPRPRQQLSVCVCVCEKERAIDRERVSGREGERARESARERGRPRERERTRERPREREGWRARERERERARERYREKGRQGERDRERGRERTKNACPLQRTNAACASAGNYPPAQPH